MLPDELTTELDEINSDGRLSTILSRSGRLTTLSRPNAENKLDAMMDMSDRFDLSSLFG
jgi:hypothetical protein